jgi:hypothetical protein
MKAATFTALAMILVAGSAFADAGAPVPEKPAGGPPSGRPGPALNDDKCEAIWDMLTEGQEDDDTLTLDKASPHLVNFERVDTNQDKQISEDEFEKGCEEGWVQEEASRAGDSGGGQTPEAPKKPQP